MSLKDFIRYFNRKINPNFKMNPPQDITKELSKQLIQENKDFLKVHNILMDLLMKLSSAGKGHILKWTDGERTILISLKDIKDASYLWKEYIQSLPLKIKELKRKRKSSRVKLQPESLSNVYIPVYVTDALKKFFLNNPEGFGGAITREISRAFQSGFMLRMTINTLFHLYANHNKLQDEKNKQYINFDDHMRECFANTQVGFVNVDKGDKKIKVPAEEVGIKASTVQIIYEQEKDKEEVKEGKRRPISEDGCYTFHFYSITSFNCCSVNSIEKFARPDKFKAQFEALQDEDVQKSMIKDFAFVKATADSLNPKKTAKRIASEARSPNRSPNRSPARSPSKSGGVKTPSRLSMRASSPTRASSPARSPKQSFMM